MTCTEQFWMIYYLSIVTHIAIAVGIPIVGNCVTWFRNFKAQMMHDHSQLGLIVKNKKAEE